MPHVPYGLSRRKFLSSSRFRKFVEAERCRGAHFLTPLTIPYRNSHQHASCCMQSLHLVFLAGLVGVGFPAGIGGGQVATEALSMVCA